MANVIAYIGLDHGTGEWAEAQAYDAIASRLTQAGIDACTATPAMGMYKKQWERSIRLEVMGYEAGTVVAVLEQLTHDLAQECIGYTVDGGAMLFTANATVYEERAALALATA